MNIHPIQLSSVFVKELHIYADDPPSAGGELDNLRFALEVGTGTYNPQDKTVAVGVRLLSKGESEENDDAEANNDTPSHSPSLRVEILGKFIVDDESFPVDKIGEWAEKNAPYILLPYLREHVYSLTMRAGYAPLILPMYQVPVFNLVPKDKSGTDQE